MNFFLTTQGHQISSVSFTASKLTDHSDIADPGACSCGVLHTDTVAAAVLSLCLADVEAEVASGAVETDLLVCLHLLIILLPGYSRSWFAAVVSGERAGVSHLHHHPVPEVQVQNGWF